MGQCSFRLGGYGLLLPRQRHHDDGFRRRVEIHDQEARIIVWSCDAGWLLNHDVVFPVRPTQTRLGTGEQEAPGAQSEGVCRELSAKAVTALAFRPASERCRPNWLQLARPRQPSELDIQDLPGLAPTRLRHGEWGGPGIKHGPRHLARGCSGLLLRGLSRMAPRCPDHRVGSTEPQAQIGVFLQPGIAHAGQCEAGQPTQQPAATATRCRLSPTRRLGATTQPLH